MSMMGDTCGNRGTVAYVASDVALAPLGLLIVQPTPFCNISCSYCYLSHRSDTRRMSLATVQSIARFVQDAKLRDSKLAIVWHAGEPLAMPCEFYEAAFHVLEAEGAPMQFQHHFQTNAVLIDDNWCQLFKKWSVRVGISIDGPKAVHDAHRVDRAGRGTFDRVMVGVAKLREHEIPFTVIGVLTPNALAEPSAVWGFFEELGAAQIGLNVDEAEGVNSSSTLSRPDAVASLDAFLRLVVAQQSRTPRVRFREFDSMRGHLTAPPGSDVLRADNMPGSIISIDVDGNFTTFSPELLGNEHPRYGRFAWGNVHSDDLQSLLRHPGFETAYRDIRDGIEQCRATCVYFSVCGGGNPSNKLTELGTFAGTETQYCRLHVQALANVVLESLEHEIGRLPAPVSCAS
jgi:uncharacterized protein